MCVSCLLVHKTKYIHLSYRLLADKIIVSSFVSHHWALRKSAVSM